MIKEIQSEIWYVLILWIIITWGIMICDFDQQLKSHDFCQSWEYNLTPQEGTGFIDSIVKPE